VVTIAVGQIGSSVTSATSYNGAGGGGGTFVALSGTPLFVAGGGGGDGAWSGNDSGTLRQGFDGVTNVSGTTSLFGAPAGSVGFGGESHVNTSGTASLNNYDSGAGGGFYGGGENGDGILSNNPDTNSGGGGNGFDSNLLGGGRSTTYVQSSDGGFGGAGGGSPICGGGGGGYTGGGGSYRNLATASDAGGGGGSFITSEATDVATTDGFYNLEPEFNGQPIVNLGAHNDGNGYVFVRLVGEVSITPTPTSSVQTTPTVTPSVTPTISVTPTNSPTPTVSPSQTFGVTFVGDFIGGQAPSTQIIEDWATFRSQLTGTYNSFSWTSTNGRGTTVTDSLVQQLADALREGTPTNVNISGVEWFVGISCGTATAVEFSNISTCSASSTYSLRPDIANANWGGTDESTVGAPTQTITLTFS